MQTNRENKNKEEEKQNTAFKHTLQLILSFKKKKEKKKYH